jgi:predicted AAA+ superfamily ATPase
MAEYRLRIADAQLDRALDALGAVLIEGVKGCGKTQTARQRAASEILLDQVADGDQLLAVNPGLLLDGPTPRLIDEWQRVPAVWDAVRRRVDDRRDRGQFILTGSATPADDVPRHSGAGRFARLRMRPLTLAELGHSTREISLARLLAGEDVPSAVSEISVPRYAEHVVTGGWPLLIGRGPDEATTYLQSYLDTLIEVDILTVSGTRRDPRRVRRFLHAYAQLTAHPAKVATIVQRAGGGDDRSPLPASRLGEVPEERSLSRWAAEPYLDAARRLMVLDDVDAWSPNLRSRSQLVETPKRHLVDASLAAALMRCSPQRLLEDLETFGFLFESLVTRDVRVYAQDNDAEIYHYREAAGRFEVDLIIEDRDGNWMGVEVKLGGGHSIDAGAGSLLKLASDRVAKRPLALMVVTGGQYSYRRTDGVYVVPLGCLGP